MALVFMLAIATLLAPDGTGPRPQLPPDERILATFHQRIGDYVEIHRLAAAGLVDPSLCADPEELSRQSALLAAAIRDARPAASEGEIFTVTVSTVFRARIAHAVHAAGMAPMAATDDEESGVEVYARIPAGVWNHAWAPIVGRLPVLPPELEYQFVGRHLVLIDVRANLVVDVLRYALPPARVPRDIVPASPCDVHPDLPACWM
jgi:hypothetical protein